MEYYVNPFHPKQGGNTGCENSLCGCKRDSYVNLHFNILEGSFEIWIKSYKPKI